MYRYQRKYITFSYDDITWFKLTLTGDGTVMPVTNGV